VYVCVWRGDDNEQINGMREQKGVRKTRESEWRGEMHQDEETGQIND